MSPEEKYANDEMAHFPLHWDDQTRQLVKFMLKEAYRAGHQIGFDLGQGTGKGVAVQLLYNVIENLQETK